MPYIETITALKTRRINNTPSIYGTFAEIGAGQEVVNHFFKAGQASQTVAKSMSAYDMDFSDEIYGPSDRYVSENRLFKMLDHEYTLLQSRLKKKRGSCTRFFAFADTVAVSTAGRNSEEPFSARPHGWMGIRFQNKPGTAYNEMIIHLNLLDKTRLQQYETLGILGVNLIYSAFYTAKKPKNIIASLFDNFESSRVDIDVLSCSGGVFKHLNRQEMNLELIRQNLTRAMLFQSRGKNPPPPDVLYGQPVLLVSPPSEKTDLRPVIEQCLAYIKSAGSPPPFLLLDIPLPLLKRRPLEYFLKNTLLK